jgi:hypothetical protein
MLQISPNRVHDRSGQLRTGHLIPASLQLIQKSKNRRAQQADHDRRQG